MPEKNYPHKIIQLEAGATWWAKDCIGKGYNTMLKVMLFNHLFDNNLTSKIEIRTDSENKYAQRALSTMGIPYQETIKNHILVHRLNADGTQILRNTVIYSITAPQWYESVKYTCCRSILSY